MTTTALAQTTTGLAAALVAAQAAARAVGKDATNQFHRYKYASAEAIIEEGRGALGVGGLALLPLGWTFQRETPAHDKSPVGTLFSRYRLLHGASGEALDLDVAWFVIPEKGRPEDKALAGALTTSLAYLLRGLLLLPREDADAAQDQRDDRNYEPRPSGSAQRSQSAPASSEADMVRDVLLERVAAAASKADMKPIAEAAQKQLAAHRGHLDAVVAAYNARWKELAATAQAANGGAAA